MDNSGSLFGLTVVGVPSDRVQEGVAVVEQKLVVRPFNSLLEQIHEVVAIDLPAETRTQTLSREGVLPGYRLFTVSVY